MPTVLILGATGYLSLPVAQSLLRSGNYTVYGLARTSAKAKTLAANEISPVVGDVTDTSTFTHLISSIPIDIVIDAASAYEAAPGILKAIAAASKSRIEKLANENAPNCPKMGFVYVSGSWVHGSVNGPVSDMIPAGTSLSKGDTCHCGWLASGS